MTGAGWVWAWGLYLVAGVGAAAVLDYRRSGSGRGALVAAALAGSVAFAAMAAALARPDAVSRIVLPAPFPVLWLGPLPLASLWSVLASLLFLAVVLGTWSHPLQRQILYSLVPLMAGVGVFLWSRDGLMLLAAWEMVSATTYLGLVTTRRARPVWHAGWVLLGLSEVGGMLLFLALLYLTPPAGSALHDSFGALTAMARLAPVAVRTLVLVLALLAFGVKAGVFPLMIWMPLAEPEAPGAVAGVFSGLLPALAISGILAFAAMVPAGIGWGIILVVLGTLGALTGALYSVVSRHTMRVLAYSTLEMMGVVFAALGIWQLATHDAPRSIAGTLALDGAVTIIVMHAGSKFLLFMATDFTGRVSRVLDRTGGLVHPAPWTGALTLGGILTIAAIPPLGGFVGEWLVLESILVPLGPAHHLADLHSALMVAGGFLVLAMALGVSAYLRWFGFLFLGPAHSPRRMPAAEPAVSLRGALLVGLVPAVVAGPGSVWLVPAINRGLRAAGVLAGPAGVIAPTRYESSGSLLVRLGANVIPAPLAQGSVFNPQGFSVNDPYVLAWVGAALVVILMLLGRGVRRRVRRVTPWTGGSEPYSADTSFSAEGFVHPLRLAFAAFFGLRRERRDMTGVRFYRHTIVYRVERHLYEPVLFVGVLVGRAIRKMQNGSLNGYMGYLWAAILIGIFVLARLASHGSGG